MSRKVFWVFIANTCSIQIIFHLFLVYFHEFLSQPPESSNWNISVKWNMRNISGKCLRLDWENSPPDFNTSKQYNCYKMYIIWSSSIYRLHKILFCLKIFENFVQRNFLLRLATIVDMSSDWPRYVTKKVPTSQWAVTLKPVQFSTHKVYYTVMYWQIIQLSDLGLHSNFIISRHFSHHRVVGKCPFQRFMSSTV